MADMKRRGFFGTIAAAIAGRVVIATSVPEAMPRVPMMDKSRLTPEHAKQYFPLPGNYIGGSYYGGAEFTVDCNSVIQFDPAKHIRVGLAVFHKDGNNNA